MTDAAAFASFEQKWFEAHPELAVAALFLAPAQRRVANAFGCLTHELAEAALRIREPQVAAAKLGWWRDELGAAPKGQTRHPVTRQLFADGRAGALGTAPWVALVEAALAVVDRPAAADQEALLRQYRPLAAAVARLETLLAFGATSADDVESNAALWTISHLVRDLPRVSAEADPLPLPFDLLARHELTRGDLAEATPQRAALLRDHLDSLAAALRRHSAAPVARTLYQRVRSATDARLIADARGAADPLERLRRDAGSGLWSNLWLSWREARRLERTPGGPP